MTDYFCSLFLPFLMFHLSRMVAIYQKFMTLYHVQYISHFLGLVFDHVQGA